MKIISDMQSDSVAQWLTENKYAMNASIDECCHHFLQTSEISKNESEVVRGVLVQLTLYIDLQTKRFRRRASCINIL